MSSIDVERALRVWHETRRQLFAFVFGADEAVSSAGTITYMDDRIIQVGGAGGVELEWADAVLFDLDRIEGQVRSLMLEWSGGRRALLTRR